jgi:hypothetical protein
MLLQVEDGLPVVKCRSCGLLYVDIQGEEVVESQARHWEGVYSDLAANRSDGHASREILFNNTLQGRFSSISSSDPRRAKCYWRGEIGSWI